MGFFQKKLRGVRRRKGGSDDEEDIPSSKKSSFISKLFRFPRPLICILILCSSLSLVSLVGCRFLKVNIGFNPANVNIESSTLDVGIFSVCDPNNNGSCSYYPDPYHALGFNKMFGRYYQMYDNIKVGGDGSSNFQVPGDPKWTGVKVMGIMSALLFFIGTILVLLMEFTKLKITTEIICNFIFAAALCECVKCGCFFFVEMCVSNVWIDNTHIRTEGSYLKAAESCKFGQSSIMSTFTIVISTVTLCIVNMNKTSKNESTDEGNEDTVLQYDSDEEEDRRHSAGRYSFWGFSLINTRCSFIQKMRQGSNLSRRSVESKDEDLTNLLVTTSKLINENKQTPTNKNTDDPELGREPQQQQQQQQQQVTKNQNKALYLESNIINQNRRFAPINSDSRNNASDDESYSTNSSNSEANSYENCTSAASTEVINNNNNKKNNQHQLSSPHRSDNYYPHRQPQPQQPQQESPRQDPMYNKKYHHRDDNDDPPEYQEDFRDSNDYLHNRDNYAYTSRDQVLRQDEIEFHQNPNTDAKLSPKSPFLQKSPDRHPPKFDDYSSDSS